jgi:hypothetical protein
MEPVVDVMKYVFRSTGTAVPTRPLVQRADYDALPSTTQPSAPPVDMEDLVERVYRRWQDALRRERERGAW